MNSLKIKKNDKVVVLSGKDRGKTGKVLGTVPSEAKVVVEGINMVTCHIKPRKQGEEGGIVINTSNLSEDWVGYCTIYGDSAGAFSEKAKREHNLLVVPADGFGCPGYFRLSYCVANDMIQRSLPAFKAMIESYK